MKRWFFAILICLSLAACLRKETDGRLRGAEALIPESPAAALDSLRAIDPNTLSEQDRHLRDFLLVKSADKGYFTHTSDSLILRIIRYESDHKGNGRYAEALYYGGRVYSDLGDYPTAMQYFQDALDALDSEPENLDLKANIASQYGRLLTNLRLYEQAIPLIKTSLSVGRQMNDTVNVIYDLQLLGATYRRAKRYREAEEALKEALALSKNLEEYHHAKSKMHIADVKYSIGDNDSALFYIRGVEKVVEP